MTVKSLLVVAVSALVLVGCSSEDEHHSEYLAEGTSLSPTIETLPDLKGKSSADPATVGLYNVEVKCDGDQQIVSFRIRTQGTGALNVKGEELKSVGAKTLYARQVTVNDQNRQQIELDLHQFTAPVKESVFIQLSGGSGMSGSYETTLPPVC